MKKYALILSTFLILIFLSGISFAQEDTFNDTITSFEDNDIITTDINAPQDIYTAENSDTFTKLKNEIDSENEINLMKNYTYISKYDSSLKNGINIDKEVTINGNNFTIDGNGISTIFNIKSNGKLTLNNINIINTFKGDSTMLNNQGELKLNMVNFTSHRSIQTAGNGVFRDIYNTGNLTIKNSNFIDSTFDITSNQYTNLHDLKIRGFIDNAATLYIENTAFDNNQMKPTNQFGRYPEVTPVLYNNNPLETVILNNITVTNNKIQYSSSSQETFKGFIKNENGNLIINNSLFENNTALFPNSNSECGGILSAENGTILINNTIFKTNEFNDALIIYSADDLVIMRSVFDSNSKSKYLIQNKKYQPMNITNNIFLDNSVKTKIIDTKSNLLLKIDENYWGTNAPYFRDIASINYDPSYIVLNFSGPSIVSDAEAIYTVNLTQLNNGTALNKNGLYDYYINVGSNNLKTTTPVTLKNGIGYYIYAPYDSGEDILSAGSIKLKINVTEIYLNAGIEIFTEYSNTAYAGTNNVITSRIFVNRDFGTYTIKLYANGIQVAETIEQLSRTPKEIRLTDNTIRPINQSTVIGANNPKINYTVGVYGNENLISASSIVVPLLYNGYLGKEYEYPITDLNFDFNTTVNGDIIIQIQDDSTYIGSSATLKEYEWRTVITSDSRFTSGFLYIPYNWDKTTTGPYPDFKLTFNNQNINGKVVGRYRDQSNMGGSGTYGYGVLIYDITDVLQNGRNTLKLEKENGLTAVYPPTLITMYNKTGSEVIKNIYIRNGADLLYNYYNLAERPVESNTQIDVESLDNITKAKLYVFAAGAFNNEADAKFNDKLYKNIWENSTGTNYHGAFEADVLNLLKTTNKVTFISTGGTILALQNILVLEHPKIREKIQINIGTEYSNTAYAGTNNTITANVKVNKTGSYTIKLLANGIEKANITQELTESWIKILLTDSTIYEIDNTTVSGHENKKINYTIQICENNNILESKSLIVPLLYNGYLGKDYAYPMDNSEFQYDKTISGDIIIQIKDDSSYMGLKDTSRVDNWEIELPANSKIVDSFLYISYNWDKTTTSNYPIFDLTFNGRSINDKVIGRYKDQSNLGTSGRFGYGLIIYDVSALIYEGQNSLTLKKESGLTAVYPSALITLYNTSNSNNIKHIFIKNDADLLLNNYNLANRSVISNDLISLDLTNVTKSKLYIFAASANSGDSDLKVNDNVYSNIWENYSSTNHNGVFKIDSTNILKENNSISIISTGGIILSLQKIIVIETAIASQNTTNTNTHDENTQTAPDPIIIKKTTPKLTSKKKTFKVKSKNKKFRATLKTKNGKAIKGAKITFKIKGKKYTAKTNKKGIATVKIKLNKKGKYTITISFKGNKLYNSKTIKSRLIIKK